MTASGVSLLFCTDTLALLSAGTALIVSFSTSYGTVEVYSVTPAEKAGLSSAFETVRLLRRCV